MARMNAPTVQPGDLFRERGIAGILGRAWQRFWTHRAQRATVLILHSLDDRTLKDIGMDRSEIESVVYGRPSESVETSGRRITMCRTRDLAGASHRS